MPTSIVLKFEDVSIQSTLNDTMAAQNFKFQFLFVVSGYRSAFNYGCTADNGKFDLKEKQAGWKNVDITHAGSWFANLFDGEEQSKNYTNMMIIAHTNKKHLQLV